MLPPRPTSLPFLEAISWFDAEPYALTPFEMLRRYESGMQHHGVLATMGEQERVYVRALALHFGSFVDVSA